MAATVIRNLPDDVHASLRRVAADAPPMGIDFERLERHKRALGVTEDGPEWTEEMDDPALSRRVLGLED